MLVLSRKIGERVSVPCCDVTIEVLRISGKQVRLGVSAPHDTEIYRSEILERANRACARAAGRCESHSPAPCHVLLADSDAPLVAHYQRFLVAQGFQARVVHTALDCINELRQTPPDVLVLNPALLWGGGEGVLALMREDETVPKVPTLIHSWMPGTVYSDDQAFPIVRRTSQLLGLGQMATEIRTICHQEHAMCSALGTT